MIVFLLASAIISAPMRAQAQQKVDAKVQAKLELQHQQDLKTDVEVGAKIASEVDKQSKISTDADLIKRVQRIGAEISDIANQTPAIATWGDKRFNTFNYTFKVLQQDDPNAFSLPGGYVYIQTGLLKFVETDDELAGVIAHEISHAKFRHVATMQREQSKISTIQLPIIVAAILSGSQNAGAAITGAEVLGTAMGSGWSVQAEQAADFGGIQLMVKSKYNPTAMLTVMERLALEEKSRPQFYQNLGIFRTHPPSRERAESMIKYMAQYNIPVERSKVSTSFRAVVKPDDKSPGAVDVVFRTRNLLTFSGADALHRADQAAAQISGFMDTRPEMYEVSVAADGGVNGRSRRLLQFLPEDATAQGKTLGELQKQAVTSIRGALYTIAIRIWETH